MYLKFPLKEIVISRGFAGQKKGEASLNPEQISYFKIQNNQYSVKTVCGDVLHLDVQNLGDFIPSKFIKAPLAIDGAVLVNLSNVSYFKTVKDSFSIKMNCGEELSLDISEEKFREKIK